MKTLPQIGVREVSTTSMFQQRNSDLVIVGPYDTVPSGAPNFGPSFGQPSFECITSGHAYRIRQAGTIAQVKIYLQAVTGMTGVFVKIWRKNAAGTFDLVGTSANILGSITAGVASTATVAIPGVQEGDFIGVRITYTGSVTQIFAVKTAVVSSILWTSGTPTDTNYNWQGQSVSANNAFVVECYMQAPAIVFIGDSIMAGHPSNYSFVEGTNVTNAASAIPAKIGNGVGATFQNMAIGGQTTAQLAARFAADVVALKPKWVVINGGIEDIAASVSLSTFQTNVNAMIDAAQAADIGVIFLRLTPWTSGTNGQMSTRDTWNAWLQGRLDAVDEIAVDADEYVGTFRAGGDSGNRWNIDVDFNADGVNFNPGGQGALARAILDQIVGIVFDGIAVGAVAVGGDSVWQAGALGLGTRTPRSRLAIKASTAGARDLFTILGPNGSEAMHAYVDSGTSGALDIIDTSNGSTQVKLRGNGPNFFDAQVQIGAVNPASTAKLLLSSHEEPKMRIEQKYGFSDPWELIGFWGDPAGIGFFNATSGKMPLFMHDTGGLQVASPPYSPQITTFLIQAFQSGFRFSNKGASGSMGMALPNAVAGLHYYFEVFFTAGIATPMIIIPGDNDIIRNGTVAGGQGSTMSSYQKGSTLHMYCETAGEWWIDQMNGVWSNPLP